METRDSKHMFAFAKLFAPFAAIASSKGSHSTLVLVVKSYIK